MHLNCLLPTFLRRSNEHRYQFYPWHIGRNASSSTRANIQRWVILWTRWPRLICYYPGGCPCPAKSRLTSATIFTTSCVSRRTKFISSKSSRHVGQRQSGTNHLHWSKASLRRFPRKVVTNFKPNSDSAQERSMVSGFLYATRFEDSRRSSAIFSSLRGDRAQPSKATMECPRRYSAKSYKRYRHVQ